MIQNSGSASHEPAPRQPPHRSDAGPDDARHLRRLGRPDQAEAAAGGLSPGAQPTPAAAIRRHRRRPDADGRRRLPRSVQGQPARVREGRAATTRSRRRSRGGSTTSPASSAMPRCTADQGAARRRSTATRACCTTSRFRPAVYQTVIAAAGQRGIGEGGGAGLAAGDHREAVRHRSGQRAHAQRGRAPALRRRAGLPHRSLPRQGDRPEPAGVPLRQRHVRAGLEPALHRSRADHRRRDRRRRAACRVLRGRRRAARHGPEPHDAAARARRDGAADGFHRRERARPQDGRARVGAAARRREQPASRR